MPIKEDTRASLMSNIGFRFMSLGFKFRDSIKPRMSILEEVGIKEGIHVLDYGCGPGGYIAPLAELVGKSGKIYALDIHPLAIQKVQKLASKRRLDNVQTILSDCKTGLPSDSIDLVLLYDVFHDLNNTNTVLAELHRVLKPKGILSFNDHHMKEEEIISQITSEGLCKLSAKGKNNYSFFKE